MNELERVVEGALRVIDRKSEYQRGYYDGLDNALDIVKGHQPAAGEWHEMSDGLPEKVNGKSYLLSGGLQMAIAEWSDEYNCWLCDYARVQLCDHHLMNCFERWAEIQEISDEID